MIASLVPQAIIVQAQQIRSPLPCAKLGIIAQVEVQQQLRTVQHQATMLSKALLCK